MTDAKNQEITEDVTEDDDAVETTAPIKKVKTRKIVHRRKSKKEKESPLLSAIRLVVEGGKIDVGAKTALKSSKSGKAKLLILSNNMPPAMQKKVNGFVSASSVPVIVFDGSSVALGSVCGKPYPVSVLSVFDVGSSNILDLVKKK